MKFIREELSQNPTFNTVVGLSNTSFDPENLIANRGATEGQIKIVHDMIKALQDWLDEFGCSDDPYEQIKAKVDELEATIDVCCANPQDALIQALTDRLDALEQAITDCCEGGGGGGGGICDGNIITVSFGWNGMNPYTDGGKATAVSADTSRQIAGFYFLCYDGEQNIYFKTSTARGGDFIWTINGQGDVTATNGSSYNWAKAIVAVDTQGCEGIVQVDLPQANFGG